MSYAKKFAAVLAVGSLTSAAAVAAPVVFPGNGHSYDVVVNSTIDWNAAGASASSAGGYLATITSADEQAFIQSLLGSASAPTGSYFFGLQERTDGVFGPTHGESSTYFNWDAGEPNNGVGTPETVGAVLWTQSATEPTAARSGKWNDTPVGGYPDPVVGTPAQADILRGGYLVEIDPAVSPPPTAVPIPPAIYAFPLVAGLAAFASHRMRRHA